MIDVERLKMDNRLQIVILMKILKKVREKRKSRRKRQREYRKKEDTITI